VSGFSHEWLRLRAPFDRAARDGALGRRFAASLRRGDAGPLRLIDLGAGTGANARALAPLISGDQDWLLVENDEGLIGWQAAEHIAWATREGYTVTRDPDWVIVADGLARWRFRPWRLDLAREIDTALAAPCEGITMAALIDLVSAAWLDRLADRLARRRVPVLSVLTVDGRRHWQPDAPEDATVSDAFARHQKRDKGFGPALGAGAALYFGARLAAAGFAVTTAPSDWRVEPAQRAMLAALIEGEASAACEASPHAAVAIMGWAARRRGEMAGGRLSVAIGHRDILALPRDF
jgi:hypothetical protein